MQTTDSISKRKIPQTIVLGIDTATQMEPSFIKKKKKRFCYKNIASRKQLRKWQLLLTRLLQLLGRGLL
jgi:hypothetical protein